MNYLKKILKVIFFPVAFIAGEFFIQYIFVAIFNTSKLLKYRELYPDYNDIDIINNANYKAELSKYLNNNALLISLVIFIIFSFIFIGLIRKNNKEKVSIDTNILISVFFLGVFISIFFNTFIYVLNGIVYISDSYKLTSIPLFVSIITSGILGPILEELLFRGIVYNKLLTFNSHKKACIITSIMFSLIHIPNITTMIYTFFLSFIMIYLYDKYKTLKVPIIFHIGINTAMNVLIYILIKGSIVINSLLLLMSLSLIVIVLKNIYSYKAREITM